MQPQQRDDALVFFALRVVQRIVTSGIDVGRARAGGEQTLYNVGMAALYRDHQRGIAILVGSHAGAARQQQCGGMAGRRCEVRVAMVGRGAWV
jgi:hypothetical protein